MLEHLLEIVYDVMTELNFDLVLCQCELVGCADVNVGFIEGASDGDVVQISIPIITITNLWSVVKRQHAFTGCRDKYFPLSEHGQSECAL